MSQRKRLRQALNTKKKRLDKKNNQLKRKAFREVKMVEISISVKGETESGEDSTYKQKFVCYEKVFCDVEDETIKGYIEQTLDNAKIKPDDIKVRMLMVVQ